MNLCAVCEADIPADFTTCGPECTATLAGTGGVIQHAPAAEIPEAPEGVPLVSVEQVAMAYNLSNGTVYNYRQSGKLKPYRRAGRGRKIGFIEEEVMNALGKPPGYDYIYRPLEQPKPLTPAEVKTQAEEIGAALQVEAWRERGLKAAKQAFRDVMLEGADEAKARGDYRTQARFLEDFVFFEDGLELVYNGRKREERE